MDPVEGPMCDILIRPYRAGDCRALAQLFYETVHTVNARDYTGEQLDAWATGDVDLAAWEASFLRHYTLVAEAGGQIVGFADMDKTGYLDRLYVHQDFQRQGIATALCDALERLCPCERYTVHASITAQPFFLDRGYQVVREQRVERQGVFLTNFSMEKPGLTRGIRSEYRKG